MAPFFIVAHPFGGQGDAGGFCVQELMDDDSADFKIESLFRVGVNFEVRVMKVV